MKEINNIRDKTQTKTTNKNHKHKRELRLAYGRVSTIQQVKDGN